MLRQSHPLRPPKPGRLVPMKGDDNRVWHAWRDACDSCEHRHPKFGCIAMGTLVYESGAEYGFSLVPGGCTRWTPIATALAAGDTDTGAEHRC